MIGITFALPSESSSLVGRLTSRERRDDLIFGKIGTHDVAIAHTGVGAKDCNEHLERLIHKTRPRFVISAGFAGAVTNELHVADLILAENFSDPELLAKAERALTAQAAKRVELFTSASIVDSAEQRNAIARASGADAVDMETGAIVEICKAHVLRLLSLRVISDSPGEPLPVPPTVLFDIEFQRTRFGRLLAYILRDPGSGWRLIRFSKQIGRVRAHLTDAIVEIVKQS